MNRIYQNCSKSDRETGRGALTHKLLAFATFAFLVLVSPCSAHADGIDIVWLITRVGGHRYHPAVQVAIVIGLMIVNYLLNLVILAIPAARFLGIKLRALMKDLVVFTLLAQIADRASAVAGFLLGLSIIKVAGLRGEQEVFAGLVLGACLNFVFAGLTIALLALWYLMRRWGVERRRAIQIAVLAAVITNPAWLMMIPFILVLVARSGP